MDTITEEDLNSLIARRRALSGENYEKARKNVLEFLKGSGRISEEQYQRLLHSRGGH